MSIKTTPFPREFSPQNVLPLIMPKKESSSPLLRIKVFFKRFFHLLRYRHWETNNSLARHLISQLKDRGSTTSKTRAIFNAIINTPIKGNLKKILNDEFVPKKTDPIPTKNTTENPPPITQPRRVATRQEIIPDASSPVDLIHQREGTTFMNFFEYNIPEVNEVKSAKYIALLNKIEDPDTKSFWKASHLIIGSEFHEPLRKIDQARGVLRMSPMKGKFTTTYKDELSANYIAVITSLRTLIVLLGQEKALDRDDDLSRIKTYVFAQAYNLFATNSLESANEDLLNLLTNYPNAMKLPEEGTLMDMMKGMHEIIVKAPEEATTSFFNQLGRTVYDKVRGYDPLANGNPPHQMEMIRFNELKVQILGFGFPTITSCAIDPIFKAFLHELKSKKEKLFYVSNLERNAWHESTQSANIMNLQALKEFENCIVGITLPKNSHFYEGKENHSAKAFKEKIVALYSGNSKTLEKKGLKIEVIDYPKEEGIYFPNSIRTNTTYDFTKILDDMASFIIKFMDLKEDADISSKEQKFFIELFNNLLMLFLVDKIKPTHMNFVCRDGIDRGAGSLTWFLSFLLLLAGTHNEAKAIKRLIHAFFPRAYWVKKRGVIGKRVDRYLNDFTQLETLTKDPKKLEALKGFIKTLCPELNSLGLDGFKQAQLNKK